MARVRLPEWLWRGRSIDAVRARLAKTEAQREVRERARLALALAGRAEEPSEPLAPGPDRVIACELYREASRWALVALAGGEPASSAPDQLWRAANAGLLLRAAGDEARRERLRAQIEQPSSVDYARLGPAELAAALGELKAFAGALVAAASADELELRRLRRQRRVRTSMIWLLLAFASFRAWLVLRDGLDFRDDLARGKPWTASSTALRCDPEARRCENHFGMTIFFHTREEHSPWLLIDLQTEQTVSSLRVRNRTDCCSQLALPLVVELSTDQKTFREVARRDDNFRTWLPEFAPTPARWVRLRVDRRSTLHLERVSVYR